MELLVGDGLSRTREFFRFCREELGCHGVVKTDEETLTLRQDADGLFDAAPLFPGVESVEGLDAERAVPIGSGPLPALRGKDCSIPCAWGGCGKST
ncbi:MAG: hypothetical protein HY347_01120 [candidate division NC10 bacterium]|nr:hypothetical protein [candidate division NC10 bacterium]